mmetsp:Transcript_26086/g.36785  ORF Transcript_26086/g.36785 Transcript_26086/m.36785 type:complete len:348 (-) Transcript_26086:2085-3128(-)
MAVGKPLKVSPNLKGLFAGSGRDCLSNEKVVKSILDLTGKAPSDVNVVYIGTATYDLPEPKAKQTCQFIKAGCNIKCVDVVDKVPSYPKLSATMDEADVIVVSGGNTLYAVDRWKLLDIDQMLRGAMHRGAVLTGGSAGAICWFQSGHSDSADPDTYREAMILREATKRSSNEEVAAANSSSNGEQDNKKDWDYIKIEGLGFLPGLICPHHDKIQSNGVLRADDFDSMLLRHPTELGICIDHYAALEVRGNRYRVIAVEGKGGSVLPDQTFSRGGKGVPGIWLKMVIDREVQRMLCPQEGNIEGLLHKPRTVVRDHRVDICRKENPDGGEVPEMLYSDGSCDSLPVY